MWKENDEYFKEELYYQYQRVLELDRKLHVMKNKGVINYSQSNYPRSFLQFFFLENKSFKIKKFIYIY